MSLAETAAVASATASSVAAVNSEATLEPGLDETGPSTAPIQLDSLSKPTGSSTPLSISVSVSAAAISSASSIIATETSSSTTGEAEANHQDHNSSEHSVDFQHAKHSMTTRTPSSPLPSMSSVSEDSGVAVKQEAEAEAETEVPSSSAAPTSSSTVASPTPLSPSPLPSTMVTIDKGRPIPTSNALSSSLKSRLSASAPLSSLSSVTPTTIISPKPYPPFTPATSSSMSSFSKSDPTQLARGSSSAYVAYPTPGSRHDDIHIKSPSPTDNRQHRLHSAADEAEGDEGVESDEEYEVVEEEEYEAMEEYNELESESGTISGMKHGSSHPDEEDTDMIDVSAGSSSPPPSGKDPNLPSSSAAGRERPISPSSPSTVASGDGPFSISAGGSGSKSPSPRLAPQQPDAAESPRSVKSPGGGIKKDSKVGVTATTCANCGTTSTPLWRRASDGQTICNACGLYFKARNLTRPPWLKRNMVLKKDEETEDAEGQASSSASAVASKDGAVAGSTPSNTTEKNAEETQPASTTSTTEEKEKQSESCPGDGSCKANGGQPCTVCAGTTQQQTGRQNLVCANCRTTTTPLWRRDSSGNTICNACGLYFKLHNVHRPVTMKRAVIKRRKPSASVSSEAPIPKATATA
ncbi:putative electron transfer flavoprotein subunit [Mortierella alpina]|nr:putative electron transfer flavoprotein subunit [Mortierella alpina]